MTFLKSQFEDCHFNEIIFPLLGGEYSLPEARRETIFPPLRGEKSVSKARQEITWNVLILPYFDPHRN